MIEPNANSEKTGDTPPTKQAVYDAAVRLFARNGFAATGMRELSREAGVNLATVNYFYGSKKGLLKAILEDYFTGVLAVLTETLDGDDALDIKFRRIVAAVARYFELEREKLLIALTELPHDDPDITDFKAQWFGRLQRLLQDGLGDAASHVPAGVIGPAIVGMVASRFLFLPVVEKALPGATTSAGEAYPDMIADLFVYGLDGLATAGDRHG